MFHFELCGSLAKLMLHFLEGVEALDDEAIEIISAHHKTQHLIINKDLKGHGGEIGKKFEDELKKASKRYFSKRKN